MISASRYAEAASQLIRDARSKTGLTQGEFAKLMGSKQSLISRYESTHTPPPADLLMHCMHILDLYPPPEPRAAAKPAVAEGPLSPATPWLPPIQHALANLVAAIEAASKTSQKLP